MANIITIFVVVIMTALVLFATQQQYTYAQIPGVPGSDNSNNPSENTASKTSTNNTSGDFLTYENNQYGYILRYPSDWNAHETTISPDIEKVPSAFISSVNIVSPGSRDVSLSVTVKDVAQFLDTNDMKVKSKTPHDYVLDRINEFATSTLDQKYVKDKPVMLINNTTPAWELHYTYPYKSFGVVGEVRTAYTIEYFMIKDNRLYVFDFTTYPLQVPTFLPITQKMIDSFQIIK